MKKRIAYFLLAIVLLFSTIHSVHLIADDVDKKSSNDISEHIQVSQLDVHTSDAHQELPLFKNGIITQEVHALTNGSHIQLAFHIEATQKQWQENDYFTISFQANQMQFDSTPKESKEYIYDTQGKTLFSYILEEGEEQYKLHFTLTQEGANHIFDAPIIVEVNGEMAWQEHSESTKIMINDQVVVETLNIRQPLSQEGPVIMPTYPNVESDAIQNIQQKVIFPYDGISNRGVYQLQLHQKSMRSYYEGVDSWQTQNYVVVNTLDDYHTFYGAQDIQIYAPIFRPGYDSNGQVVGVSNEVQLNFNVTEYFTLLIQEEQESNEIFLKRIANQPLTYGFTNDWQQVSINFGNIGNNGIALFASDQSMMDYMYAMYPATQYAQETIELYITETHDSMSSIAYAPLYFEVELGVKLVDTAHKEYNSTSVATYEQSNGTSISISDNTILENTKYQEAQMSTQAMSITLQNKDAITNENIQGMQFILQKQNISGEYENYSSAKISDANGEIHYTNVESGTYRFQQITEIQAYDSNTVVMSSGHIATIVETDGSFVVEEQVKEGKRIIASHQRKANYTLSLTNMDEHSAAFLSGASFNVEKREGNNWYFVHTLTTNGQGFASINSSQGFTPGQYRLIQTGAPLFYELESTVYTGIQVSQSDAYAYFNVEDSLVDHTIHIHATNEYVPQYEIIVSHHDLHTHTPFAHTKFTIQQFNGLQWIQLDEVETDATGQVSIQDTTQLVAGQYRIFQSGQGNPFQPSAIFFEGKNVLQKEEYAYFTLQEEVRKQSINIVVKSAEIPNYTLEIVSVDSQNNEPKVGVQYELQRETTKGWVFHATLTSDEQGRIHYDYEDGLRSANYRIYQVQQARASNPFAPHYVGDKIITKGEFAYFTIDDANVLQAINIQIKQISMSPYAITITNHAQGDVSQVLANTEFLLEVKKDEKWEVLQTFVTNQDGQITIDDTDGLGPYEYRIKQSVAPVNYMLGSAIYSGDYITQIKEYAFFSFSSTRNIQHIDMRVSNQFNVQFNVELLHVDATTKKALTDVTYTLEKLIQEEWVILTTTHTNEDGFFNLTNLDELSTGTYRLYANDLAHMTYFEGEHIVQEGYYAYFTLTNQQPSQTISILASYDPNRTLTVEKNNQIEEEVLGYTPPNTNDTSHRIGYWLLLYVACMGILKIKKYNKK